MSAVSCASGVYGAELRPARPGRPPRRSPVIKLGATEADYTVPGPGAYTPMHTQDSRKPSTSSWTMGDRNARRPAVELNDESPGPIYQMRSSVVPQCSSSRISSPRFGFGTQARQTKDRRSLTPGPGAYTPRVTCKSHTSQLSTPTCGASARTLSVNPGGSWSRHVQRSLAEPREGPGPMTYQPEKTYVKPDATKYSMRVLGERRGVATEGAEDSPGPAAYHPHVKSRRGGGHIGDSPAYSISDKDELAPKFISKHHARIFQGKHSPSPYAYTPLEGLGITTYTVSNTSTHAPMYSFGSEARSCGSQSAR